MTVTDECWTEPGFKCLTGRRKFEIENADAVTRFAAITSPVARADHDSMIGPLFAPEINHRVRNRRVALDFVSACPKKQIARFKVRKLEGLFFATNHGLELSRFAQPGILLTRIARHIAHTGICQHVINETRAIHAAAIGIGRTVLVIEAAARELERTIDNLPDFDRIVFVAVDFICTDRNRRAFFPGR